MRTGRFYVSKELIDKYPKEILDMFYQLEIIPVRAEMMFDRDAIEYIGISNKFEDVPPQNIPNDYHITTHIYNGHHNFTLEKING